MKTSFTPEQRKEFAKKGVATRQANIAKKKALQEEAFHRVYGLKNEIERLETELANLQTMLAIQTVSCKLTGKALLSEEDIVSASLPWERASGVYFLVLNNQVIYVGQSVNVYNRIGDHSSKSFDRYAYVPCSVESLDKLESLYIHYLKPPQNGNLKGFDGQVKNAPIPLDKLLQIS